jgi:hypothetical protein
MIDFGGFNAVIEREVEVVRHFGGLIACDNCRQRDNAAVAQVEAGRFHRSPNRVPCSYFSRAGATARTSSRAFVACAVDDASRDSDASVMAITFMMISYLF